MLALTGCSTLPQGSTQPEAAAALEWAEHLCEGRYTEAHALTSDEARIDSEVHAEVAEGLAEVDGLAADRLAVLADEGTEVAPRLEVEQVETASGGRAVVRLSGTCWGEELRLMVDVIEQDDGWRWKIDASMRMGGFGPWRPEWSMQLLPSLGMPVLCVLGLDLEVMGWGTLPEDVVANLPARGRFEALEGVGHFVHVEQPQVVADLVLELIS